MKSFSLFVFIALTAPNCFGQSQAHESHSSMETLHPEEHTMWFGPIGGINFNQYKTASFPFPYFEPVPISEQGESGRDLFLGISVEFPLGRSNQSMLVEEVLYDSKNASFNPGSAKDVDLKNFFFPGQRGDLSTTLSATLSYLIVATGFKYNFIESSTPSGPGIQLLLYVGYNTSANFTEHIDVVTAPDAHGMQGEQGVTVMDAIDGANKVRLGLRGEISYDIPLNGNILLTPIVGYDLPLTKVDNTNRSWTATSIYAGIAVHFGIGSGERD